ncbi:response regulator [Paenibacillus sp. ACRRX]|uniref:response regulator n=1 Tax=unclassified Paenibacillus TaxID=185978 RepID=UPI001EF69DC8|nr:MULTISPECIES: response regulator [unclassified Paenibacillus]MCG7405817.1 response regulator [Paenibacillus sp. ACRRX]MDK8182262.1 response regulator [Paenibacillus sp. UMB4589-SE434]
MIRVLIIEDDVRIAEINRRLVEKVAGYSVVGIATDEQQAKEQLQILMPDLVLLDIYFPDMSGMDFLRYLKQRQSYIDVIMITAAKDMKSVREAIQSGVFDFIMKPVIYERMFETLQKYKQYQHDIKMLSQHNSNVSQQQIDALMRGRIELAMKDPYYPKGIDKLTLDKVLTYVRYLDEGLSAERLGQSIGISRSTARRYLEYLVSEGALRADVQYGSVGRPERVYRII